MTSCITSLCFIFILCFHHALSIPISRGAEEIHNVTTYLPNYAAVLISLGALLFLAYFISGCVCCPNKSIKALSYQNGFPVSRLNENNFENQTEITIFPPRSTVIDLQPVSQPFPGFDDKVTFEPLPDILPKKFISGQSAACSSRPAHFSALLKSKVSLHDWFDDPNSNFPREQLQYLQEIGNGWFGRVVEGEASLICANEEKTAVTVKILREEASPSEHLHFLHEVRPFRDLKHSNIIKLLGRCLESDPFLLIMEHSISDLKTYLVKQEKRDNFVKDGLMLQMISNISSGLRYMHDKGFCHMDLAAHNCFICNDNSVKIGDYGVSFDRWKGDYYCLGDIALPIRWYSPEILRCSETTIETKEITKEANVWAFGVVLWEIVELGKLPYGELSDEEVLQKVLIERSAQLSPPTFDMICKDELVLVMKECWKPKKYRPSMEKIESYISQLYNDRLSIKSKELSFEERWNSIQPKITEISSYTGTESSSFKFENDFSTRSDLQNYSSDNEILSSFEMSFDILPKNGFNAQLSPSLNVLNGSIDELTDNDVYVNSISLSCGKYDADTLSNISDKDNFQMEDDKDNTESKNIASEQFSSGIRDLDIVSASQHDSSKNIILPNSNSVSHDSEIISKDKELLADRIFKDSQYLSKSSDLSNISVSSFSKSSNLSDRVEYASHDKSNEMSANSDLNGNCDFYETNVNKCDKAEIVSETNKFLVQSDINEEINNFCLKNNVVNVCPGMTKNEETSIENEFPENSRRLSIVPDIVIHESPSCNAAESLEENVDSENESSTSENKNPNKSYRFVFKEISSKEAAELSHENFKEEIAHDLTETLKKSDGSKPLTSTPVKSSSSSFSSNPNVINSDINENSLLNDVFSESNIPLTPCEFNVHNKILNSREKDFEDDCDIEIVSSPEKLNSFTDLDLSNKSSDLQNIDSYQETVNSTDIEHFTTAHSSLCLSKTDDDDVKIKTNQKDAFENTCLTESNMTLVSVANDRTSILTADSDRSNNSNTFYVSADGNLTEKENSKVFSEVISPPNGYESVSKDENCLDVDNDFSFQEDSKISGTVSPPQAFQDNGLSVDSYSESKTSFDQEFSTSAECGSSENLDQYLEDDHISQANISAAKLLETSFPDMESKSFTYETCADFSGNMRPKKNTFNLNIPDKDKRCSKMYESEYTSEDHHRYNPYKHMKSSLPSYDQMVLEDLDTGEQTVINESYSVCDDYENSAESDEILKINTETDEAIIVDSSEALIGFVPSRSIELLQEFEVIPPLNPTYTIDEEKESSDSMNIEAYNSASPSPAAMKHNSSPYESPEHAYPQPYRNFCLQNEIIEEEITDEIVSPSSFHSSSSYCSNEIFMDEEKMSQSSESAHHGEMYETSVLPSMDHLFVASDDGSKSDVSSSDCSPVQQNEILNMKYRTDAENNHISDDQEDVMHSFQPTQSIRWLSDETLDVEGENRSPIIIEGREILAGDVIQTCELTAKDIANALSQLEAKSHLHGLTPNHLNVSQSPSPFSSVESSPCRDAVYTPDFESDSEETNSGTSCSSTSGSFECIHNKFKNTVDISNVPDEIDKSASSREQSPMKIFSKTWDCHATPTRGVLLTPEKKFNSMRKSVSFHEEDPQIVFEYPPASDSSEDGYPSDDNEQYIQNIDYLKYADWDLQVCDVEDIEPEVLEIEELDSEPYVRRPAYSRSSVGPLNRPMLYTLTTGFSDEDFDLSETTPPFPLNAPSNSPEEERGTLSGSKIKDLIESQLNDLIEKNNQTKTLEDNAHSQLTRLSSANEGMSNTQASVQESTMGSVEIEDIVIDELLPESQNNENATVQNETHDDDNSLNFSEDEEVIVEELELSDADSDSESFEYNKENKPILLETDSTICYNQESMRESLTEISFLQPKAYEDIVIQNDKIEISSDSNTVCNIQNFTSGNLVLEKLSESVDPEEKFIDNLHSEKNNSCFLDNVTDLNEEDINKKIVAESSSSLIDFDFVSMNESVSPKLYKNLAQDFVDNKDTLSTSNQVTLNPSHSEYNDLKFSVPVNPVHSVNFESEFIKLSVNETNRANSDVKSIEINSCEENIPDLIASSKDSTHSLSSKDEENLETTYHSNASNSTSQTQNSTHENTEVSIDICSKEDNSGILLQEIDLQGAMSELNTSKTKSTKNCVTDGNSDSLVIESSTVSNHQSFMNEEGNGAQNVTQSSCCSIGSTTDHSEAFSPTTENEVINSQSLEDNTPISCKEETSKLHSSLVNAEKTKEACASLSTKNQDNSESSLNVPEIIVTPASESELEDELEEFLREQLRHFPPEDSPQEEDFTVTSAFSSRPFDDVFGSYISGDSTDYIEAFNFEFENGNFYDEYGDDCTRSLEIDMRDRLYPDSGREHRSSSLPLMTENLSDDDSLTMKSDSSLVYDSSKGITRL